jgi:DNA-binding response OmpR family regulator
LLFSIGLSVAQWIEKSTAHTLGQKLSRLSIDPSSFTVTRKHLRSAPLTSKEFQIVVLLQKATDHRLSRSDLVHGIWGQQKVSNNSLDVHLFNVRKKLSPLGLEIVFRPPNFYALNFQKI